jgi:large subunit ribosomal protein L13
MPNARTIERKWFVIDASGLPLGRIASQAASILRGKIKPIFVPHVDCGDFLVIKNCAKVLLTGKKREKKVRYHHTGYIGNLKEIKYSDLMEKRPERAVELAVKGMLPKNTLGRKQLTRLRLSVGEEYGYGAQKPENWSYFRKVRSYK